MFGYTIYGYNKSVYIMFGYTCTIYGYNKSVYIMFGYTIYGYNKSVYILIDALIHLVLFSFPKIVIL